MPPFDRNQRRPRRRPAETGPSRRATWRNELRGIDPGDAFAAAANASEARATIEELQPHVAPVLGGTNWTPLGPAGAIRGQTRNLATIGGRILSMEVGPLGNRAYVAAADGGVWQFDRSTIAGVDHNVWTPVDDFATSPNLVNLARGNALAASALLVQFGANARADTLFVGTGEGGMDLTVLPIDQGPSYLGVGVRVSPGSAVAGPRVWQVEGNNIRGQAIYRLFQDPDDPAVIWAAASNGMYVRPNPSAPNTPWTAIATGAGTSLPGGREITDVVITGTTAAGNKRIFAAARGGNVAGGVLTRPAGVYLSADNGVTWNPVPINPNSNANPGRIALAVSDTANQVVYRFDELGRLWRFDGATFQRVLGLPPAASTVGSQGYYDIAVAVQPGTDNDVYIAASLIMNNIAGQANPSEWEGAFYRSTLALVGGSFRFGYTSGANPDRSPLWIGAGTHADCHAIAFARNAAGTAFAPGEVWLGCDGGVFRSLTGTPNSFVALNESLAITQPTYFDHHPTDDAVVLCGTQDNGTVRGDGGAMWRVVRSADGGGVAVDPHNPLRVMTQNNGSTLFSVLDGGLSGVTTAASPTLNIGERPTMYARLVTSPPVEPDTTLLYPTTRVWVSYDWGARWRVLPGNAAPAAATFGRLNGANDRIADMTWIDQNRFHVTTGQFVYRYDRTTRQANHNNDVWARTQLANAGLPAVRALTSLGVVTAATNDIYVGVGGANTGTDHVWWFDGPAATWRPTGFGPGLVIGGVATPFDAPVNALVVDPAAPNDLYVGTDVGVFRGVRSAAAPFGWVWTLHSNGLPEATVFDLKIHGASNRLRATLHGRGVWETDLGGAATLSPDVYLRMDAADSGRHLPMARNAAHPFQPPPQTVNWTMSPDIKVRRTTTAAQAPPAYPGAQLLFATPRQAGPNVTRWQAHVQRRGFSIGADVAGTFGAGSRQAARDAQSRYGLIAWDGTRMAVDGIVGPRTWAATTSYGALPNPVTPAAFADLVGEDFVLASDLMIADAGPSQVLVQVHNRGHLVIAAGDLRVALLVAPSDPVGTAPQLPADYAARIRANDTTAWLGASGWRFGDAALVYRTNLVELNQRRPAILSWNVDFAAVGLPAGTTHALLLVLATATSAEVGASDNQLRAVERNVRTLIEGPAAAAGETKAAARLVRLDPVVAIP